MDKKKSPEAKLLWKASTFMAVAIVLGIVAATGGIFYRNSIHNQVKDMEDQLKSLQNKEVTHNQQLEMIGRFRPIYQSFESKGIFNQEPRLKWIEAVTQIGQELKFTTPLRYKLDVRKPFDAPFIPPPNNSILYVSVMTLNLSLLHEGDLFDFFRSLDHRSLGIYTVQSCAIKRTSVRYVLDGHTEWTTSLDAECVLNWFTLWEKEGIR